MKKKTLRKADGKALNLREKFALSVFMESVPILIEHWKKSLSNKSFDEYLMQIHTDHKNNYGGTKQ